MALGIAVFITAERPVEIKSIILAALCVIIGLSFIFRSSSRELTKADHLDELDERNQLIALKSNSKTSQITQLGSGILTVTFIGMGGGSARQNLTGWELQQAKKERVQKRTRSLSMQFMQFGNLKGFSARRFPR